MGVGKTSAILHLLRSKPASERWAVLVNEFGEIGVDGSLFGGQHNEEQVLFAKCPVAVYMLYRWSADAGCLKPAAQSGQTRSAVNRTHWLGPSQRGASNPFRLLPETLELQKILTLVDARNLADKRYTEHKTFNQQIAIADLVVGNKLDLYQGQEQASLRAYVEQHGSAAAQVVFTENGQLQAHQLEGKTAAKAHGHLHSSAEQKPLLSEAPIPDCGFIKAVNEGKGFRVSAGAFHPMLSFIMRNYFRF